MRLIYGVGINDADYAVNPKVNGKRFMCPAYMAWTNMLQRACSPKFHARWPTYVGVKVAEEWKSFMAFRAWWVQHHIDGYHLDKDLIGTAKLYSPDMCIYVPGWINTFINDCGSARGEWPIGVHYHRQTGKYRARCCHPFGKMEHLGLFDRPDHAHDAWRSRKLEIATELKPVMDEIDERIYPRVIEIINRAS